MKLPFQIKLNKETDQTLRRMYGALVLMVMMLLLYLGCFENVHVFQARETSGYQIIENYEESVIKDEEAPAGIRREFTWILEDIPENGNCFAFYLVHHWAEVYIDDEVVYRLMPDVGNKIGGTIGCNWVMMRLQTADIGKEIKVDLYPVYETMAEQEPVFYLGSQMLICLHQFQEDLPLLVLSILAILIGLFFLFMTAADLYLKRRSRHLGYLGLFSVMIGFWKITDLKTAPLLFPSNPMVLSYITLAMLLVFSIALMMFIKGEFPKKQYPLLDGVCYITILYGLIVTLLQMIGIMDFREILHITHFVILLFIISVVHVMICEWRREKENLRTKVTLICFLLCAAGIGADLLLFYLKGTSSGLLYTLSAFLIYIVAMGILSNRELTQKASIDRHTGLFNKSRCNELVEDESILQGNYSLILFDLNYLKQVNDTMGHKAGDQLIADFAGILRKTIRSSDFVGRYGGDEFIVIAKGARIQNAERILQDVAAAVERYNAGVGQIKISYAAGLAVSEEFGECTMHMLLEKADQRMYLQKEKMHREIE